MTGTTATQGSVFKASCFQPDYLGLVPGYAENLEKESVKVGNTTWRDLAIQVKQGRNTFYIGIALATITLIGISMSNHGLAWQGLNYLGSGLSGVILALGTAKLQKATQQIQSLIKAGKGP